jgi:hypothetical protein
MSETETIQEPRLHEGVLQSVKREGDEVIATIIFPAIEENHLAVKDLGYEITDNDPIECCINIPQHEALGIENFGDYLASQAQWVISLKEEYPPKKEFSKILIEFFDEIKDGREQ